MNIFNVIKGNLAGGPQTARFPRREAPAAAYRGPVCMDPSKCLACGICDYVCVSRAITVTPGEGACEWTYDPGRCTYCGRCVDHCPGAAMMQEADRGDAYAKSGDQHMAVEVPYPACPECGEPTAPYCEAVLGAAFGDLNTQLRERGHLCATCRQKATTAAIRERFGVPTDTGEEHR